VNAFGEIYRVRGDLRIIIALMFVICWLSIYIILPPLPLERPVWIRRWVKVYNGGTEDAFVRVVRIRREETWLPPPSPLSTIEEKIFEESLGVNESFVFEAWFQVYGELYPMFVIDVRYGGFWSEFIVDRRVDVGIYELKAIGNVTLPIYIEIKARWRNEF